MNGNGSVSKRSKASAQSLGPRIDQAAGGLPAQQQRGQQYGTIKIHQQQSSSLSSKNLSSSLSSSNSPCVVLLPLNDTFEPKTILLPFLPDVVKIGRQTNKSTVPNPDNGFFDSKVLSRSHAEMWANENGRACIKDIRSSNGTFVNGIRLSKENEESEPRELLPGDTLELGIDILNDDNGSIIHRKVSARVDHAGALTDNYLTTENASDRRGQHSTAGNGTGNQGNRTANGSNQFYDNSTHGSHTSLNGLVPNQTLLGSGRHNVTIDMVIRKLSNDLKVSKRVAADLKQATAVFTSPPSSSLSSPFGHTGASFSPSEESGAFSCRNSERSRTTAASKSQVEDVSHTLSSQLEAARRDLEAQQARVQELESSLMLEREARIEIEEKWRAVMIAKDMANSDDDAASAISDDTVTKDVVGEQGRANVPHGTDEVSEDNAGGSIERLENLLRVAREDISAWKTRAEVAENENNVKTSRIMELVAELERSHVSNQANGQPDNLQISTSSHLPSPMDKDEERSRKVEATGLVDKGGRGAAVVSMVAVVMLGMGLMSFLNDYGPKKEF